LIATSRPSVGSYDVAIGDRRARHELVIELFERCGRVLRQRAFGQRGDRLAAALAAIDMLLELPEQRRVHRAL
jgi:hypothetical protein